MQIEKKNITFTANQYLNNMKIISTSEFRSNQKKYFELAERETIFVTRRNAAPIVMRAAMEDDFLSKEELEAIQRGIEEIKVGRTLQVRKNESLDEFLNRIEIDKVIIHGEKQAYALVPVSEEDQSREEQVDSNQDKVKSEECVNIQNKEELEAFLNTL